MTKVDTTVPLVPKMAPPKPAGRFVLQGNEKAGYTIRDNHNRGIVNLAWKGDARKQAEDYLRMLNRHGGSRIPVAGLA